MESKAWKGETALNYQSTRDRRISVSAAQAIAQGICGNGGLFVPEVFPTVSARRSFRNWCKMDYCARAAHVMGIYLTDFTAEEIADCTARAYAKEKFSGGTPAPVVTLKDGISFLELWHGPTCAFKDMALQILPLLLTRSLKKIRSESGCPDSCCDVRRHRQSGAGRFPRCRGNANSGVLPAGRRQRHAGAPDAHAGGQQMFPSSPCREISTMHRPV